MPGLMDRALRERIVGAVVLVVVAVLVVPVFLDGSAEQGEVVSESVTLPGQNEQPRKQQTIVLNRDRSEPVPAAGGDAPPAAERDSPVQTETASDGAVADVPVASEPAAADAVPPAPEPADDESGETPAPAAADEGTAPEAAAPADTAPAASSTGMWAVQLGSFAQPDNAERLAAELRKAGYAAFLSQLKGQNGPLHRVRIGPQKDRASAEATARKLAADGHEGQVVPHP